LVALNLGNEWRTGIIAQREWFDDDSKRLTDRVLKADV
jgi:hypothetical protein